MYRLENFKSEISEILNSDFAIVRKKSKTYLDGCSVPSNTTEDVDGIIITHFSFFVESGREPNGVKEELVEYLNSEKFLGLNMNFNFSIEPSPEPMHSSRIEYQIYSITEGCENFFSFYSNGEKYFIPQANSLEVCPEHSAD